MSDRFSCVSRLRGAALALGLVFAASAASAQTTVVLSQPAQVTDTTIRSGSYAATNYGTQPLATQAGTTSSAVQRALVKFDTENSIPAGATITSATMTLTLKSGGADASRAITVYPVLTTFQTQEANWSVRKTSVAWSTAGGDLGSAVATMTVPNTAGTKVTVDVTMAVQQAVNAPSGSSRYTRLALVDRGSASSGSSRQYASVEDTTTSARPALKVVYSTGASTTTSGTTSQLKVLHWNTHHGGWRTDGVWDPQLLMQWVVKINPDIVSLNEVERGTSWSKGGDDLSLYLSILKQLTGKTWYGVFVVGSGASNGIGNAILSKTPFISTSSHQLSDQRAVQHASIAWNGRTFNFFSTHLDANTSSYRLTEIGELKTWAATFAEPRVIAGDFNASPGSSETSAMGQSYGDTWKMAAAAGTEIAYPANPNGNTRNGRIDYQWISSGATMLKLHSAQVFDTRNSSGVMPSDHRPLLVIYDVK
jgi:endonuclease/exonuclease/phosphatase family metal-dependent hydrolase